MGFMYLKFGEFGSNLGFCIFTIYIVLTKKEQQMIKPKFITYNFSHETNSKNIYI